MHGALGCAAPASNQPRRRHDGAPGPAGDSMSFITLSVPLDAAPGSNVQFTDPTTRQTYTVAVPQGVPPGATFPVQLAAGERRSDSDVAASVSAAAGKMALKATVATGKVSGRQHPSTVTAG